MLSLNEYWLIAKKMIMKHKVPFLLNDDDNIAYVAYYIMRADNNFNGQGNLYGWRSFNAKCAISKLKAKFIREKKKHNVSINSLDFTISDKDNKMIVECNDLLEYAQKILTSREYQCVHDYYLKGMTLEEIGNTLDLTRERIRQILKKSIGKLRRECNN